MKAATVKRSVVEEVGRLELVPVTFRQAADYVAANHRHHPAPKGWRFGCGVELGGNLVGVACAGRPVARNLPQYRTIEVTRLCTDGTANAASKMYSAIARAAKALGYKKAITYILDSEPGTSLKAAGWHLEAEVVGQSWFRPSRERVDSAPICNKQRWAIDL